MRFTPIGPSIPDELLWARDQGRVVFFCGAGVSLARAALPDFFGLAEKVMAQLAISPDSPIVKVLSEAREIGKRTGIDGLVSADRIFGLLERDFPQHDIYAAVAHALDPGPASDASAHEILVKLATTRGAWFVSSLQTLTGCLTAAERVSRHFSHLTFPIRHAQRK